MTDRAILYVLRGGSHAPADRLGPFETISEARAVATSGDTVYADERGAMAIRDAVAQTLPWKRSPLS